MKYQLLQFIYRSSFNVKKIMVRFTDKERNSVPDIVEDVINLLIKKKVVSDEEINDIIRKYQQ